MTRAQRDWLMRHPADGSILGFFSFRKTYDFVGRMRDLGLIKIVKGEHTGWPYSWEGTRLTERGRELRREMTT